MQVVQLGVDTAGREAEGVPQLPEKEVGREVSEDEANGVAFLLMLIVLSIVASVSVLVTTLGSQGDRDARRLDVIERQLNIRGPDAPTPTVDELIATAVAGAK